MPSLTKRFVDSMAAPLAGKDVIHWDDALPGFGVRVKPSGAASWVIQYRNAHGQSRRLTLGRVGRMAPDQARKAARIKLAAVDLGKDPAQERAAARNAATVGELCDQYLKDKVREIKASTLKNDRSRIEAHIRPLLGKLPVANVTEAVVQKFVRDVRDGKTAKALTRDKATGRRPKGAPITGGAGAASRALDLLQAILKPAVRDKVLPSNPVTRDIERPKSKAAKPPFSFEAVGRVGTALRDREHLELVQAQRALRLLILTGCRRMEMLTLKWRMIDARNHCIRFDDTKSGPQVRPVGAVALKLLDGFRPERLKAEAYVFPGAGESGHFVGLPKAWDRVAAAAKVDGVSLHGLRHWFASAATEMGYSDLIIGPLLGHAGRGITSRYANAPDSALVSAADRIATRLADTLDNISRGKVVPLRERA